MRGVALISCRGGGSNPLGRASTDTQRAEPASGWRQGVWDGDAVRCLVLMRLRCPKTVRVLPRARFLTRRRAELRLSSVALIHHALLRVAPLIKRTDPAQDAAFGRPQFTVLRNPHVSPHLHLNLQPWRPVHPRGGRSRTLTAHRTAFRRTRTEYFRTMLPLLLPRKTNANGKDFVKSKMTPYVQHCLSFSSANQNRPSSTS